MTRSLSAGVIAEIATNKLNPVELVYLGIGTGTYYTDHYKDLSFDGNKSKIPLFTISAI